MIGYNERNNIAKVSFNMFSAVSNSKRFATMSQLDKVLDVDIDGHGRFKYILIDVQDQASNANKPIVRGYAKAQWHGKSFY